MIDAEFFRVSWRRHLAASALGLAAMAFQGDEVRAGEKTAWQPVDLVYEVHAGGLHVFTIDMRAALDPADYDMTLALRTDGTLSWVLDWTMKSMVSGKPFERSVVPASFRTESQWRGKERWVEVDYGEAGQPKVSAMPPPEDDDRDQVPEALRLGTVDPLSAGLALIYSLAWKDGCELELPIFDGRRRFNARSRDDGQREIPTGDLSPYGGVARACAVTLDPVTGFKRDTKYRASKEDFTVFLRQVTPDTPPLPVRVEAQTKYFGGVRVHLVSVTPTEKSS